MTTHTWETIMIFSPDLFPVGEIKTNGRYYWVISYFKTPPTSMYSSFEEAVEAFWKGLYIN